MKIFRLDFNPHLKFDPNSLSAKKGFLDIFRKKEKTTFNSFYFSPPSGKETHLGYLCMLGEIKSISRPGSSSIFLYDLADIIKQEYYKPAEKSSEPLNQALAKANDFLQEKLEQYNENPAELLDNFNFTALSITKTNIINFSTVGKLKTLLFSNGQAFNMSEETINLPAHFQTFPSVIKGILNPNDKVLIATQTAFNSLSEFGFLENFAEIERYKDLKSFLKNQKQIMKKFFGCCLIIFAEKQKRHLMPSMPNMEKLQTNFIFSKPSQKMLPLSPILQKKTAKGLFYLLILILLLTLRLLIS